MPRPRAVTDPAVGAWIPDRLSTAAEDWATVASVVPTGFEAVVRVLHPVGDRTWADVAAQTGTTVHPQVQWTRIRPRGEPGADEPEEGSAPAGVLAAVLEHCVAVPSVVHAVWVGFVSWTDGPPATGLDLGHGREYALFEADLAAVTSWPGCDERWPQTANLIWPPDRSWVVATEIDWDSTLVAGGRDLATALLADPRLETFEVGYDADLSHDGDHVNPPLGPPLVP